MNSSYLQSKFDQALDWEAYLATDGQRAGNWTKIYEQVRLDDEQRRLVEGFVRDVKAFRPPYQPPQRGSA